MIRLEFNQHSGLLSTGAYRQLRMPLHQPERRP